MDYSFITECRKHEKEDWKEQEKKSFDSIIKTLFLMKVRGKDKARQIDEYDGESLFGNRTLYPGQIYAFIYRAEKPSVYDDGTIKFEYYDSLPIVLVTHVEREQVRGINLNLCNTALRAVVINTLHNLDMEFYTRKNLDMYASKQAPISNNVAKVFLNKETELAFFNHIKKECNLKNVGMIYRTYNSKSIHEIRMLEVWQHKYIPFLNYTGDLKQEILKLIYKVTGIDRLVL